MPKNSRIGAVIAISAVLGLGALLVYFNWPKSASPIESDLVDDPADDPRLTYASPFRNIRPDVKYVGDEACAGCHRDQSHGYHRHSMGRDLATIAQVAGTLPYGAKDHNPFEHAGRQYLIERNGDRISHQEIVKEPHGPALCDTRADMDFAVGSGAHAQSYLYLRGEYLWQSPITWFSLNRRWNLSPGFETLDESFERPVQAECMFCHCNYVEPVKDSMNRFKLPLFPRGLAIGCERCHGPGELHVQERKQGREVAENIDHSIVNPRHLTPELREDVCHQCHFKGEERVLRRGREPFDYRPGVPLRLFRSYFVTVPDLSEQGTFAGHAEQFCGSRCFIQSNGKFGCISCHEPHTPLAETKPAHYRQQCLTCHTEKSCKLPIADRRGRNQDNCAACHMPRRTSSDIEHTAITDHRIRRGNAAPPKPGPRVLQKGEVPIVNFHLTEIDSGNQDAKRDLGMALAEIARRPSPASSQYGRTAMPLLESSLQRWPHDPAAQESMAFLLFQRGQGQAALAMLEKVLARSPHREIALRDATYYAQQIGDRAKALEFSSRAVATSPWQTKYRVKYISELILHEKFDQAIAECGQVLEFNGRAVPIRLLLVTCFLKTGQKVRARAEFETVLKVNPPNKDELQKWFETQSR